jgi:hypothetical protein
MRIFTLIFLVSLLNAQVAVKDPNSGTTIDSLTITELGTDQLGTRVRIEGTLNGETVNETTTINSAVTTFNTSRGQKIALFTKRPYPMPILPPTLENTAEFTRELNAAAMDRIQIKNYQDSQEAQRLGFSSTGEMKRFTGQNRSKIAQARKNGSADPVADVMAEADAKADYKASAEQQDHDVAVTYENIYMNLQPIFQEAQMPIYAGTSTTPYTPKPTEKQIARFAAVCSKIEEIRTNFLTVKRKVLRTGDITIDTANQDRYIRGLKFLREQKIKTTPPFTRVDINQTQRVVDSLKDLMLLPLSN